MISGVKTYESGSFLVILGVKTFRKGLRKIESSKTSLFTSFFGQNVPVLYISETYLYFWLKIYIWGFSKLLIPNMITKKS